MKRRIDESLGQEAPMSRDVVPPPVSVKGRSPTRYDKTPPTTNPSVNDLPAATAPPRDKTVMPSILDPVEGAVSCNLEQLLAYAIEHAPEYRSEKEELFLTTLALLQERHLWGPRFFDTVTASVLGTPEGGDEEQAARIVNELGVTQRLPYGGQVSASVLTRFVEELRRSTNEDVFSEGQTTELNVSATIPLLRGAGLVAQEDLIQASRDLTYATRNFERYRREFLVQVSIQYYDLVQQQANIRNLELNVANFEQLATRMDRLARAGREPYFEVQRAQQQVLFARNTLVNTQEAYSTKLDQLKLIIGMPTTQALVIRPTDLVIPAPVLDPVTSVATGLRLRLDLQNTGDQIEDAQRRLKVAKNQLLPDLDLFANTRLPTDPGLRRTWRLEPGAGEYEAGVTLDIPLDRRIEEIGYRRAMVQLERAQRSYTLERDRVALEIRQASRQIQQAQFALALQEANVDLALKRRYGVELRRATLRPRDVIEAENDLLLARQRRDQALRDLRVSILRFLLASGQLRVAATGTWLPPTHLVPLDTPVTQPTTQPATQPATQSAP